LIKFKIIRKNTQKYAINKYISYFIIINDNNLIQFDSLNIEIFQKYAKMHMYPLIISLLLFIINAQYNIIIDKIQNYTKKYAINYFIIINNNNLIQFDLLNIEIFQKYAKMHTYPLVAR
jgi:hypothetical protein